MSSGAQAQIAASQAATEAQAQAAANALAFAREQYGEARTNRAPYLRAGASATTALMQLLGLGEGLVQGGGGIGGIGGGGGGGTGGGGTLLGLAGAGGSSGGGAGGGTGGSGGGGGTSGGAGTGAGDMFGPKYPGLVPPLYHAGDVGFEDPVPGTRPIWNEQTGRWEVPADEPWRRGEAPPPDESTDTTGLPPLVPTDPVTRSGTASTDTVTVTRNGQRLTIPASLLSWYLNMGYTQG